MISILRQRQIRKDENQRSIMKKKKAEEEQSKKRKEIDQATYNIPSGVFTTDHYGKKLNITAPKPEKMAKLITNAPNVTTSLVSNNESKMKTKSTISSKKGDKEQKVITKGKLLDNPVFREQIRNQKIVQEGIANDESKSTKANELHPQEEAANNNQLNMRKFMKA